MNLLADMYRDSYFPDFLVDKIKSQLENIIEFLERGIDDLEAIQEKLDETIIAINELEDEFDENGSELETAARESIADSVYLILKKYDINIDIEEAIRMREW